MKHFKDVLYPELFERTIAQAPGTRITHTFDDRLRMKIEDLMNADPKNPLDEKIVQEFDNRQARWMTV